MIINERTRSVVYNVAPSNNNKNNSKNVIAIFDHQRLLKFINTNIIREVTNMSSSCYYPKTGKIYSELLFLCNTTEESLKKYSINHYGHPEWKLLHDPYTTLIILITQSFLNLKNEVAAQQIFNLLALRYYTNYMYKVIKHCSTDYFDGAMSMLSKNHMFIRKKTIPASIFWFSQCIFNIYKPSMVKNKPIDMYKMIYGLRTRIVQSIKSFQQKYYEAAEGKGNITNIEEDDFRNKQSLDRRIKELSFKLTNDICSYSSIDDEAFNQSLQLTKFSRNIGQFYIRTLSNHKYMDLISQSYILYIKSYYDPQFNDMKTTNDLLRILNVCKKLMSVKYTTKQVYFKKTISEISDKIVEELKIKDKYDNWSIQTQALSKQFIAYYLSIYFYNQFLKG